jgi:hypothetical protein
LSRNKSIPLYQNDDKNGSPGLEHMCYSDIVIKKVRQMMKLLKLAVEKQRWDLAAHTIVLAAARTLRQGDRPHASQSTPEIKRIKNKGKSETGRLLPKSA